MASLPYSQDTLICGIRAVPRSSNIETFFESSCEEPPKKEKCFSIRFPSSFTKFQRYTRTRTNLAEKKKKFIRFTLLTFDAIRSSHYSFFNHHLSLAWMSSLVLFFIYLQGLILNKSILRRYSARGSSLEIDGTILVGMGALNTNDIRKYGDFYRLLWSIFLHKNLSHLILNLFCQSQFISFVVASWGFLRTFLAFIVSGLTGNLLSAVCNPCSTSVGSSGALFGMMGASAIYYLEHLKSLPSPKFIFFLYGITALVTMVWGYQANIDNWAHLGGFIGGMTFSLMTIRQFSYASMALPDTPANTSELDFMGINNSSLWSLSYHRFLSLITAKAEHYSCLCGLKEWLIRGIACAILISLWIVLWQLLFHNYNYEPIGQITFKKIQSCCCCYLSRINIEKTIHNYRCAYCDTAYNQTLSWGGFCSSHI